MAWRFTCAARWSGGPAPEWTTALLGVPALLAVVVGFLTVRRHPTAGYDRGAVRGLGAGVVGAALISLAITVAGGPVGPGRMADVGTPFLDLFAASVVSLGLGALAGGVAAVWWLRRHGYEPPEESSTGSSTGPADSDTEDTIRL